MISPFGILDTKARGILGNRSTPPTTCIRERLDRFIGSPFWLAHYLNTMAEHSLRYKSDHSTIIIRPNHFSRPIRRHGFILKPSGFWMMHVKGLCGQFGLGLLGSPWVGWLSHIGDGLKLWSANSYIFIGKQIEKVEKEPVCSTAAYFRGYV